MTFSLSRRGLPASTQVRDSAGGLGRRHAVPGAGPLPGGPGAEPAAPEWEPARCAQGGHGADQGRPGEPK